MTKRQSNKLVKILNELYYPDEYPRSKYRDTTLYTRYELHDIYGALRDGKKPQFINADICKFLDLCGISYKTRGIGWVVE